MSVFEQQTYLEIRLTTGIDLNAATTLQILYQKPSGTSGAWTATIVDGATGDTLKYQLSDDDIDEDGLWKFQSYVVIGGKKAPGTVVTQQFERTLITI